MPRVLSQFKVAEMDRQLLLIQGNAREIALTLKWKQDSLRALSFNMGAIEITRNKSTDVPIQVVQKRVKKMLVRWYQENPEVVAIHLFDRQGMERFAVGREGAELTVLPERKARSCSTSLIAQADLHPDGSVYNAGFKLSTEHGEEPFPVMRLGVALQDEGGIIGAACLSLDISPILQRYSGYLVQYDKKSHGFTPLYNSSDSVVELEITKKISPVEPVMMSDKNGLPLALIPFFADEHFTENVFLVYPVPLGGAMVWVSKWRKQVLILFGLVSLIIFLIAVKLSTVIDHFSKELLTSLHDLLHKKQPVALSWSGPKEVRSLSRDLNKLSLQYTESLQSQEVMQLKNRKMESELRQSEKMKALGLLAGGVAHDLNNILSGIVSYPQLLLLQLPKESELRTAILEIQHSGERAAAVVADLLTVARGVACKKEYDNLNSLTQEYLESPECKTQQKHYPEVSCSSRLYSDELPVFCSPIHIKKALMNLVTNATESIQGEGQIFVLTRRERLAAKDLIDTNLLPGDYAILQIKDTGPGIGDEDLEHIFEPFYSNKKMGRSGTGLGLTVVWNTMNDHDGRVKVTSSEEGTCFELFFPLHQGEQIDHVEVKAAMDLQGNGEQILVIDDESQQRDLATKILTAYGYQVESVTSGEEAVKFLMTQESDLLLLDMIMDPGMNGYETYRQILEIWPNQKAIIVSGFSESHIVENAKKLGATDFVKKPYSIEILAQTVKKALKAERNI